MAGNEYLQMQSIFHVTQRVPVCMKDSGRCVYVAFVHVFAMTVRHTFITFYQCSCKRITRKCWLFSPMHNHKTRAFLHIEVRTTIQFAPHLKNIHARFGSIRWQALNEMTVRRCHLDCIRPLDPHSFIYTSPLARCNICLYTSSVLGVRIVTTADVQLCTRTLH